VSGDVELTFLGNSFEGLGGAFDSILAVISVSRQQPDHLIGAAGGRTGNVAGSEIDSLSDDVFVLHALLHHARMPAAPAIPRAKPTIIPCNCLAWHRQARPVPPSMADTQFCRF